MIPGKTRAASVDDEVLNKKTASPRPGLKRRPFSVAVGLADLFKESKELKERKPADELSKQQSGSDESISAQGESSTIDSGYSEVEETRSRKTSSQFDRSSTLGRATPSRTKHVVISSFFAEESGEVSLEEGEEVEVLQKESSGWWYVKNDFCEGWAPSAFLAPAAGSRSTSAPDQPQIFDNQDESCQIKEKLDSCPRQPADQEEEKRFVPQEKFKVGI